MGNIPRNDQTFSGNSLEPIAFFAGHGQDKSIGAGQDPSSC